MGRQTVFGWRLVCLGVGMLAGTAGLCQQKHLLKDIAAAGDVCVIDRSLDVSMKVMVSGQSATVTADAPDAPVLGTFIYRERERYQEELLAADRSGLNPVRRTYSIARSVSRDPLGEEEVEVSSLQGRTVVIRRQGGKVSISPDKGKLAAEDQEALVEEFSGPSSSTLPGRAVAPGEEWTIDAKLLAYLIDELKQGQATGRFLDVVPFAGHPCARVQVSADVSGKVDELAGAVTVKLSGQEHYALDLRRWLAWEATGPLTMNGKDEVDGVILAISGEGTAKEKATCRWIKVAGKRVAAK